MSLPSRGSLRDRVLEAAGAGQLALLRRFTGHFLLAGSLVEPLVRRHSLKEIIAKGDLKTRSVRISGFSNSVGAWGFSPQFVTIQSDDGGVLGARQKAFEVPRCDADRVYFCGLSIWTCITSPSGLLGPNTQTTELGAVCEDGETLWRLKAKAPEDVLAYAREVVMYFDADGLLRRTDFDVECGERIELSHYASAHQTFAGLTIPTLHRIVKRVTRDRGLRASPILDIEVFDVTFDRAVGAEISPRSGR